MLSSFVVQDVRRILCGNHVLPSLQRKKHDYFASVFEIKEHVCTSAFMRTTFVFHFVFLFNLFFPRWWDRNPKYYACHVLSRYRQIWHKHLPQSQCNRSCLLQTQLRSFLSLYFCLNFLNTSAGFSLLRNHYKCSRTSCDSETGFLFVE